MGGVKARGHPIGATALYQVCEIVQQLTGQAGSARPVPPPVIGTDSGSGVNSESARNARREARQ